MTPQRIAIVEAFANEDTHPTAQDLYEKLKRAFPTMSFATVYNTLSTLCELGLTNMVREGGNAARFDPNVDPHHHAVCERCGDIEDVPAVTLEPDASTIRELRKSAPGFAVRSVERVFRGLCSNCKP